MTTPTMTVADIAAALGETEETPLTAIRRIVERLGIAWALDVLQETRRVEASGGMLTNDGMRRRTPGGTYFYLVRQRLMEEGRDSDLRAIFPQSARRPRDRDSFRYRSPMPDVVQRVRPRVKGSPPSSSLLPLSSRSLGATRPVNQAAILAVIERHIGKPATLYRRSINPNTGAVTLAFHFPEVARSRYGAAIAAAAAEAGITIDIAPQPHQGALADAARNVLPPSLVIEKVAIHATEQMVRVRAKGTIAPPILTNAQNRFTEQTGWKLEVVMPATPPAPATPPTTV